MIEMRCVWPAMLQIAIAVSVLLLVGSAAIAQPNRPPGQPPQAPPTDEREIVDSADVPSEGDLMVNGDFEQPAEDGTHPRHWQAVDRLVWYWTTDPDAPERGKVIRVDTDVNQRQAYRWSIDHFVHGKPLDDAPQKKPTTPPKYDTIAGLDGGFYWSDYIPVKPGGAYRVYVDAKGPPSMVFIRGYEEKLPLSFADEAPAVQQQFREARGDPTHDERGRPIRYRLRYLYTTWFPVGGSDTWQTYTHRQPRHPNNREITENVRYIRIMLCPFWPPGEYWYDNVRVFEVGEEED